MSSDQLKIKAAYDLNPTAGDDTSKTVYIPTDLNDNQATTYSDVQLANRLALLLNLTGTALPNPSVINDFTVIAGSHAPTTLRYTFTASTITDGSSLIYDLYDNNLGLIISGINPAQIQVELGGLDPSFAYNLTVRAYVTNNPTRLSTSNNQALTTGAMGTISNLVVDDKIDAPYDALISAFTVSPAPGETLDEWIYQINNTTKPASNDIRWAALPNVGVDTIPFTGIGTYTVSAWAREALFPTSITPLFSDTVDITNSGGAGGAILGFGTAVMTINEEGAPDLLVDVIKSNDVNPSTTVQFDTSAGSGLFPAVPDSNYKTTSVSVAHTTGVSVQQIPVPVLWKNLGNNQVTFQLDLSSPVNGTLNAQASQIIVTIRGTKGYWSTLNAQGKFDIDVFNPPVLPASPAITAVNNQVIEGLDFTNTGLFCVDASLTNGVIIQNNIMSQAQEDAILSTNATNIMVRNNYIYDSNTNNHPDRGYAIGNYTAGESTSSNHTYVGNRVEDCAGMSRPEFAFAFAGYKQNNNYIKNMRNVGSQGNDIIWVGCLQMNAPEFKYNVCVHSDVTIRKGDFVNTFRSGCSAGNPSVIIGNYMIGSSTEPNSTSGTGILVGDDATNTDGRWEVRFNTTIEVGLSCYSITGGIDNVVEYNDGYSPSDWVGVKRFDIVGGGGGTSVGLPSWRQPAQPNPQALPGTYSNATFRRNRVLYYTDTGAGPVKSLSFHPSTGSDGLTPNHGAVAGGADSVPTDWLTNVEMTSWDGGGGDAALRNVKHVLSQPAIGDGIYIMYASDQCLSGDGTLVLDATAGTVTFAANGDSVGAPVDITTPETPGWTGDYRYFVNSNNAEYVRILITPSLIPVSGTTIYTVKVTDFKVRDIGIYPGITGEWV